MCTSDDIIIRSYHTAFNRAELLPVLMVLVLQGPNSEHQSLCGYVVGLPPGYYLKMKHI